MDFLEIFTDLTSLLSGIGLGFGCAFLIVTGLLNRSNNLGDSVSDDDSISTGILFTSQENRPGVNVFNPAAGQIYVDSQLANIVRSREYQEYSQNALDTSKELVTRHDLEADNTSMNN